MPESKGPGKPILTFADAAHFDAWLEEFHGDSSGIRLRIAKKGAADHSITYEEALECALRWGWIDSRKEKADEDSWLQHFTPRRSGSVWSRINRDKAERLIAEGRMQPPGLEAVDEARRSGSWDKAYDSQSRMELPEDFAAELERRPAARVFFAGLDSRNRYAMLYRVHQAKKPETRAARILAFADMLERGERIYPKK